MASLGEDGRAEHGASVGSVLGRTFGVLAGNPATVFGLAFLFGALPQLAFTLAGRVVTADLIDSFGTAGTVATGAVGLFLYLFVNSLLQGALVRATMAYGDGRRAGLGECLRAGLPAALSLILLSLLTVIGYAIGFLLLIFPAVLLYVRWAVAVPVLVEERRGVLGALRRSADLGRGARWTIFGLGLVTLILVWLASVVAGVGSVLAGPLAGGLDYPSPALLAVGVLSSTLVSAFWSTVPTALYAELREWKDGPSVERLADVFA